MSQSIEKHKLIEKNYTEQTVTQEKNELEKLQTEVNELKIKIEELKHYLLMPAFIRKL